MFIYNDISLIMIKLNLNNSIMFIPDKMRIEGYSDQSGVSL